MINCKNAVGTYEWELDKNVEEMNLIGTNFNTILCQSSTIKRLRIDHCDIGSLFGTPHTVYASNSRIGSVSLGPRGFGATLTATFDNCDLGLFPDDLDSWQLAYDPTEYTFSNGTLSRLISVGAVPWGIPGAIINISTANSPTFRWRDSPFQLLRVYTDGLNTLIDTTMTQQQFDDMTGRRFIVHPCPNLIMNNCRGSAQGDGITDGVQDYKGAAGPVPLYSRGFRRYSTPAEIADAGDIYCKGGLVELRINVIKAYTGTQPTLTFDESGINIDFSIDAKVEGERVIMPTLRSGFTANDSSNAPGDFNDWFEQSLTGLGLSEDISAEGPETWPVIEVTVVTDQELAGRGGRSTFVPTPNIREVTSAGDVTADATIDDVIVINKTVGAATTVNLPPVAGRAPNRPLKIVDGKLDAAANNITLDGDGSETILGIGTYVINSNGGSVEVWPRPDGAGWYI